MKKPYITQEQREIMKHDSGYSDILKFDMAEKRFFREIRRKFEPLFDKILKFIR